MKKNLRAAVVGVGHLGQHHARIYTQIPGVQLVAIADNDEKRAKIIADRFSVKAENSYHSLLNQVDIVSIAVPTNAHFDIARDFLQAGIHVLVEKPITTDVDTARDLVKIARDNSCKLQVGHSERFNPMVIELVKRNIKPVYLEAVRTSPFRFRSGDISVILDLMIHDIDIISTLANSRIEQVQAIGGNILGSLEDMVNARLTFANGCVANITASRVALTAMRTIRIFTANSYMTIDYSTSQGKIYRKAPEVNMKNFNLQKGIPTHCVGLSFEEIFYGKMLVEEKLAPEKCEPLYAELESFVNCIRKNTIPVVSGEDGLKAMEIAQMISEDIRRNVGQRPLD